MGIRDLFRREKRSAYGFTYPNVYVDEAGRMGRLFPDINSGVIVDETSTLSVAGIWRAVTLVSDAIGGLPFAAYRGEKYVDPQPNLLLKPNPTETRIETLSAMVASLIIHGNYIAILGEPGVNGYPDSIFPVACHRVQVKRVDGELVYRVGERDYSASEVLHIKGFSMPGEHVGYGIPPRNGRPSAARSPSTPTRRGTSTEALSRPGSSTRRILTSLRKRPTR